MTTTKRIKVTLEEMRQRAEACRLDALAEVPDLLATVATRRADYDALAEAFDMLFEITREFVEAGQALLPDAERIVKDLKGERASTYVGVARQAASGASYPVAEAIATQARRLMALLPGIAPALTATAPPTSFAEAHAQDLRRLEGVLGR
jgi:uncharacterized protein with von Willebrand factor type A (vWA) domain